MIKVLETEIEDNGWEGTTVTIKVRRMPDGMAMTDPESRADVIPLDVRCHVHTWLEQSR